VTGSVNEQRVFARGDFECFGRDYAAIRRSKAQLIGNSDERGQIGQVTRFIPEFLSILNAIDSDFHLRTSLIPQRGPAAMPKQDRVNVCAARAAPADAIEPATAHAFEQGGTQDMDLRSYSGVSRAWSARFELGRILCSALAR
jgi:hypothetical protein